MKRRALLHAGSATAVAAGLTAVHGTSSAQTPKPGGQLIVTDGTARINDLLIASLNVDIPAGVYMITGELHVRDGHVISAAAGAEVTLKAAASYGGRMVASHDKSFTLRGLNFDGSYQERMALEGDAGAPLIQIVGGSNVTLENNQFLYAPSFAIWAWRSAFLQIRGNSFLECYQPVRIDGANLSSGAIDGNTFTNTAAFRSIQHIDALHTVNLTIRGNTMQGAGLAEPKAHGYEGTWGNSIFLVNSTAYLVEGNKVYANHWSSLVSGAGSSKGTIRNNYLSAGVRSSAAMWIEQPGATHIRVEGNEIDGGISCGDTGGDHIAIINNIIRSREVGIDVNAGAKTVLIQGNRISSKSPHPNKNGLYLWEKNTPDVNVQIVGNHIEGFDKAIAINNSRGVGHVYGIRLAGNTFGANNTNVWIPSAIVLHRPLGQ